MKKLERKLGVDNKGFLEDLIEQAGIFAKDEVEQARYAAWHGFILRAKRLLKAESGDILHAPNDSPRKLWADYSGALST